MKLLTCHEFTNSALLETYYLSPADQARFSVPECDVIGLRRVTAQGNDSMTVMRPDEALIMARMLIDAVREVTEGYEISELALTNHPPLSSCCHAPMRPADNESRSQWRIWICGQCRRRVSEPLPETELPEMV